VLVAVFGPLPIGSKKAQIDKATVEVIFKSESGQSTHYDGEQSSLVRSTVEAMILRALHPRTMISVIVQVLSSDGSLLAAAINAASLALVDAGIQCSDMLAAVTLAEDADGRVLVDPTRDEAAAATNLLTAAFGAKHSGVVLSDTRGLFASTAAYLERTVQARTACTSLLGFFRLLLKQRVSKATKMSI
jgi:exosome complex component RRP46